AGRIVSIRAMGKASFATIQDQTGKVQFYIREDEVDNYETFQKATDIGDIAGIEGTVFRTKMGEITIDTKKFTILAKSLRPLPEKWHGLQDKEIRYRKRFLDLICNQEIKELFIKRTEFIKNIRNFLDQEGFLEVETPVLEEIPGGADANPFKTHHDALNTDLYLRIALELHLKRLLVGGYEKVYEIGKVFRNEGISTQHLQEFTMLEFYQAYADYEEMMKFTEKLYTEIIKKTFNKLEFEFEQKKISFKTPWEKIDYYELMKKETGIDLEKTKTKQQLVEEIEKKNLGQGIDLNTGKGRIIDQLYKKHARPKITGPAFLINHPTEVSPLAKPHRKLEGRVERFQVIIQGIETTNAFSELNDPIDQRKRFEEQAKLREAGDKEAQMLDENFLEALEVGMPPAAGNGMGIDRLFMILTGQESIRDTVIFPMMRPEGKE
ncbi:MAG: lysine--tRNA ligase, partial [archaeon]